MTKPAKPKPADPKAGPGDQQPDETDPAFQAFRAYLEMGPQRSTAKVGRALSKSKTLMTRWSKRHAWVRRVREYEATATRAADDQHMDAIAKRSRRQAEIAQVHGEATALVAHALLSKVAADPKAVQGLTVPELLALEHSMARAHNRAVVTERLALGITTDQPGEALPRSQAEEISRRLSDVELDGRLTGVDELAEARARRRVRRAAGGDA